MTHIITHALALAAGNCVGITKTVKISGTLRLKSIELSHLPCLTVSIQSVMQHDLKTQ